MAPHPYAPFVRWSMNTYYRGSWHDAELSEPTVGWLRSFGLVAGRIDKFLRLGHQGEQMLPNSLILDILVLNHSPLNKTLKDEFQQCLLRTWTEMIGVYGQTSASSDREANRLELLAEWGHALRIVPGSGFPGGHNLLLRYRYERARLDLTQLCKDYISFKYVGIVLELLKIREQIIGPSILALPPTSTPAPRLTVPRACSAETKPTSGTAPTGGTRKHDYENERLPCLPTSRRQSTAPSACLAYELSEIWRDHWRNTLS